MRNQVYKAQGGPVSESFAHKKKHQRRKYRLHRQARKAGYVLKTANRTFYLPQSEVDAEGGGK